MTAYEGKNLFIFIGERRSQTAIERGWTWADGRLAAKTLSDALAPLGLRYNKGYICLNLLDDRGVFSTRTIRQFRTHPAARGAIRQRTAYQTHVREALSPLLCHT